MLLYISGEYNCDQLQKIEFFDPYFMRCVTIHAPADMPVKLEGPENGFTLVSLSGGYFFDVRKYSEYLHHIPGLLDMSHTTSGGEGIRVLIHPPDSKPYPWTDGKYLFVTHYGCYTDRSVRNQISEDHKRAVCDNMGYTPRINCPTLYNYAIHFWLVFGPILAHK